MRTRIVFLSLLLIIFVSTLPLQSNSLLPVEATLTLPSDMPVVFVDPLNATASVGETFTISVRVFNLSGDFYPTDVLWNEGQPLPPLQPNDWRYNLSLGHLYAVDLRLKWDPTILDYVSHTVMVPVDYYPGGILNGPGIIMARNEVNETAGTYTLAVASVTPARGFNLPDDNATAFTMTFNAQAAGACDITFTNVDLAVDLVGLGMPFNVPQEIPHWTINGRLEAIGRARPVGDVDGDFDVDMFDIVAVCSLYGCRESNPNWNPNADIAPRWGIIDIFDCVTCAYHYEKQYPKGT